MTPDDFRARLAALRVYTRGDVRAPHKPLLLLYALARFADGVERLPYNEVEAPLLSLLRDFGPPRGKHQAFSFQRLQSDGLWTVDGDDAIRRTASGDWHLTDARRENPVGRFPDDVAALLRAHPALIGEAARALLAVHFEPSFDDEILDAVGLDLDALATPSAVPGRRRRDPAFREAVLRAYGYRCAVCGFETRVANVLVGVDAAHLWWHGHGGPDDVANGVALCALHHRLLDRGAFTLAAPSTHERMVVVADDAHGGAGFERWLLAFHGQPLAAPVQPGDRVAEPSMGWHRREVFRGRARP